MTGGGRRNHSARSPNNPPVDYLLAGIVGIGLAAACGLRAFLPVLGLALAARAGWVELGESFAWLASWPAIVALSLATAVEVSGSLVPYLAHVLDALAAPVACAAGAFVVASQAGAHGFGPEITSSQPLLEWSAALVAGGGVAGAVHAASATLRGAVSAASAGIAAPVYGAMETAAGVVASILAFVLPLVFALLTVAALALCVAFGVRVLRRSARRSPAFA